MLILPVGDENPRERTPYVTYTLVGINVAVYILFHFPVPTEGEFLGWALVPARGGFEWWTWFTHMFMHGDPLHIIGNMVFLWIFGDNIEDAVGHVGMVFFYLLVGLGAAGLHVVLSLDSLVDGVTTWTHFTEQNMEIPSAYRPMLGASGAISGVMGAYLVFFPRHRVKTFVWLWFFITVVRIEAVWYMGIYILMQLFLIYSGTQGVAVWAHIGGFVAGLAVGLPIRYLFLTKKLGPITTPRHIPKEIRGPSRPETRTRGVEKPFIVFQDDRGRPAGPSARPDDKFLVLRDTDELKNIGKIAAVTGAITGESSQIVTQRLNTSRGIIAKGMHAGAADRIRYELHKLGIESIVVPMRDSYLAPRAIRVDHFSWNDEGFSYRWGNETSTVPWGTAILYFGGRLAGETHLDIFLSTDRRIRLDLKTPLSMVNTVRRTQEKGFLQDLALAILNKRKSGVVNDGIRVLAHRGKWGWLAFTKTEDYEDHVLWVYNIVLYEMPINL